MTATELGFVPSAAPSQRTEPTQRSYADQPLPWLLGTAVVGGALAIGAPLAFAAILVLLILGAIRALSPGDATTVLSLATMALFMIPQRYVFEPLGAAGTPAILLGVGSLIWWAIGRVGGTRGLATGYQPIRIAVAILFATVLIGYAAGWTRGLVQIEANGADRSGIIWLGYIGITLLAADGITSRHRLDDVLRRVVWGGSYMCFVAMLQWFINIDLARLLAPPGLYYNAAANESRDLFLRGQFFRVSGTAMHPIEFSVVAAALMPIAVAYAFNDRHRPLLARWTPVVLLGFAMPMAISRSGFLGIAVAGVLMVPALPASRRVMLSVLGVMGAMAMTVIVPGLLGTIRDWFLSVQSDSSVGARAEDYTLLNTFVNERLWFGRGFGTFVPPLYNFLDNQYLLTLIESGLVGVIGLFLFLLGGLGTASATRKRAGDEPTRLLAQALLAAIATHVVTLATYDALVFPTTGMSLFLIIGCTGALWRFTRLAHPDAAPDSAQPVPAKVGPTTVDTSSLAGQSG